MLESPNALRLRAAQPGGFDSPEDTFRRAAWLCLLHLSHLERGQAAATRAAPNVSAPDSAERHAQAQGEGSPPSSSSVAESVSRSDGAPHLRHSISALRGSAASGDAAGHLDLSTLNGTGSYVNIDGWQVGGPPTDGDEWQTVSSKRARKKRRQPDASQHSVAESSMSAAAETSAVASSSEVDASVNGFSRTRTLSEIEDRLSSSSSSQGESNPESKAAQRAALKEQRKKRKAAKKKGTVLEDSSQQAPAEKLQINEEAPSQRTQTHLDQSDSRDGTSSEADGAGDGAPAEASSTAVNGAQAEEKSYDTLPDDQKAHRDERQVDLDVNRSFVGYTSGPLSDQAIRGRRREQLRQVVIGVLRKHPALNYFQGYHDILSVLILTLCPESPPAGAFSPEGSPELAETLACAERVSLHLIRDSMTQDLDPVMGQLKVVRNILRAADPALAAQVEQASPLPYFALSWIITLFSHDVDSLAITKRIFDYFLSHGPASILYLCVALLIAKKTELRALDPEVAEDPALLHHALSRLPRITPDSIGEPSLQAASKERGPSASEKESHGQDDTAEKSGLYADPDVYPPESRGQKDSQGTALPDIPLSKLLSEAVSLQRQFPLMAPEVGADRIMGAKSVIFTWDQLRASHRTGDDARNGSGDAVSQDDEETPLDWAAEDAAAEAIVSKTDLIVLDAHPSPPPSEAEEPIYGDDKEGDEKAGRRPSKHTKRSKLRRPASKDVAVGTVIAVMGVAGVLMAIYAGERRDSVAEIKAAVGYFGTVIGYVTGM